MSTPDLDPAFLARVESASLPTLLREYRAERTVWKRIMRDAKAGTCTVHPLVTDFRGFLRNFGSKPHPHWSLDRFDNADPEYSPTKAGWASPTTQNRNRSNTQMLTGCGAHEAGVTTTAARWQSARRLWR